MNNAVTASAAGVYVLDGKIADAKTLAAQGISEKQLDNAYKGTMAYAVLSAHNTLERTEKGAPLKIKFDAMASHDITYVGIIQNAKASGLEKFPLPYVLTNCHNSLCAVGGTINEDDHVFGLSAAKRYGGIFVPPHQAVIHTYMREQMSGCGRMILGSDSHTRYGALGTMAVGEGGPELVKQLLGRTYDINYPDVVAVVLKGKPAKGVGPQDVALSLIGRVFPGGFVKNKVLEFIGEGVDAVVEIDLDKVRPVIAMPFHPANTYDLQEVIDNPEDVMREAETKANDLLKGKGRLDLLSKVKDGKIYVEQGIIAGCAGGTYDNIIEAASILRGRDIGTGKFTLSVYPSSTPIYADLMKKGALADIIDAGAIVKTAFCGPCFGAGDVPANGALSIRHTTRNFESREGSKPGAGQMAGVALMDSRSIAATAANGGVLTSAYGLDYDDTVPPFEYDEKIYGRRVYNGWNKPLGTPLEYGPNIKDWPEMKPLADNAIFKVAAAIYDPVTTTDELIPSGETSSYRSNPLGLAEFALSRKVPEYVGRAKAVKADGEKLEKDGLFGEYAAAVKAGGLNLEGGVQIGSAVFAVKPGDGSAREQAASCQRVLGGACNIAREYATKRYRSNLINWGMIPFISEEDFEAGDIVIVPGVRKGVERGDRTFAAKLVRGGVSRDVTLKLDALTPDEKEIILSGSLINYYKRG